MKRTMFALLISTVVACSNQPAQLFRQQSNHELSVTRTQNRAAMTETITASTSEGPISATARLARYNPHKHAQPHWWLGLDGGTPDIVLADLSLVVAGQHVAIPRSLYADFGDFAFRDSIIGFASGGDRLFLKYCGGDAAV
jgi:hypothetical protein